MRTIEEIIKDCPSELIGNPTVRELCQRFQMQQQILDIRRTVIDEQSALIGVLNGKVDELRDALEHLMDEQNGPPLARYAADWHRAMEVASNLLGRTESTEYHRQQLEELSCGTKTTNPTPGSPTPETSPNTSTE